MSRTISITILIAALQLGSLTLVQAIAQAQTGLSHFTCSDLSTLYNSEGFTPPDRGIPSRRQGGGTR